MLVNADLVGVVERVLDRLERVEREVVTKDGRWHLMRALPYRTADDHIDGVVLTFVDITERKQSEERLRASEERLRGALQIETVGVMFFDDDRVITDANDAFLGMTGYSRQDVERGAVRWTDMTPPEWMGVTVEAFEQLVSMGRVNPYEKEYLRKDGSRFWALSTAKRLNHQESVGFVIDLTARKQADEQLRRSDARLRLVIESVTNYAIFTVDPHGLIRDVEPRCDAYVRVLGRGDRRATGGRLVHRRRSGQRRRPAGDDRCSRQRPIARRAVAHAKRRLSILASGMLAGLRSDHDELIGFVRIARDLTERKHWEDALQTAHDELESRVEQRTSELADVNASLDSELREHRQAEERVRALLGRLMTVQEDERRRIARDLHDHLGSRSPA